MLSSTSRMVTILCTGQSLPQLSSLTSFSCSRCCEIALSMISVWSMIHVVTSQIVWIHCLKTVRLRGWVLVERTGTMSVISAASRRWLTGRLVRTFFF